MREFLHVDDMAAASIHVMELAREVWQENTAPMLSHINVGTGVDCTIRELAQTIAKVVGYGAGWCSTPRSRMARRVNCSTSRACISLAGITKFHWRQGLPVLTSGSLRISNGSGGDNVLRQEDFAAVVRTTPSSPSISSWKTAVGKFYWASVSTVRRRATGLCRGGGCAKTKRWRPPLHA